MRDLRRLVLVNATRAAKRMVIAAIRGSRDVYLNRTSRQVRQQWREPPGNLEDEGEENPVEEIPEEGDTVHLVFNKKAVVVFARPQGGIEEEIKLE